MRPVRQPLALLAAVAAAVFAGCGGSDTSTSPAAPPTDAAVPTVEKYVAAFRAGDGEAVCALFTKAGEQLALDAVAGTEYEADNCEAAVAELAPALKPALEDAAIATSSETETTATVAVNAKDGAPVTVLNLVKVDGDWLTDGAPPPG